MPDPYRWDEEEEEPSLAELLPKRQPSIAEQLPKRAQGVTADGVVRPDASTESPDPGLEKLGAIMIGVGTAWQATREATKYMGPTGAVGYWATEPETGGIARTMRALMSGESALTGGVRTGLDKWYYDDKTIPWWDVPKAWGMNLLRGVGGSVAPAGVQAKLGSTEFMSDLSATPRYGEPLTALYRLMELDPKRPGGWERMMETGAAAKAPMSKPGYMHELQTQIDDGTITEEEAKQRYEAYVPAYPPTRFGPNELRYGYKPRIGQLTATSATPEGYGKTGTAVSPYIHGGIMGLLGDPVSWLRGPGPTRKGSAARLKQNFGKDLSKVYEAGPQYWGDFLPPDTGWKLLGPKPSRTRKFLETVAGAEKQYGKLLPLAKTAKAKTAAGQYALVRDASGNPVVRGDWFYDLGEKARAATRGKGLFTRAVDDVGRAMSTEWRPMVERTSTGEELLPMATSQEWSEMSTAGKRLVEGPRLAGAHEVDEFIKALRGVDLHTREEALRLLSLYETTGEIPEGARGLFKAISPWYDDAWLRQLKRGRGTPIKRKPYIPQLRPSKETFRTYREGKAALGTVDEAVDVGRAVRGPEGIREAMVGEFAPPSFAKHRKFQGTISELYESEPRLKNTHPIFGFVERTRAAAEFEAMLDGMNEVAQQLGRAASPEDMARALATDAMPEGWRVVAGVPTDAAHGAMPYQVIATPEKLAEAHARGLPTYMLPSEFVEFTNNFSGGYSRKGWPAALVAYRQKILAPWKVSHLGLRPPYWARNEVTENFWNWYRDPEVFAPVNMDAAYRTVRKMEGTFESVEGTRSFKWHKKHAGPMLEHQGQFIAEEAEEVAALAPPTMARTIGKPAAWAMRKLSPPIEDFTRWMQYYHELGQGATMVQAVEMTHAYHINYSRLTPWWNKVGKTIWPFSTFPVGATKIIARETVRQPHKTAAVGRAMKGFEDLAEYATGATKPPMEYVPEYIERQAPLYGGRTPEGKDVWRPQLNYTPISQIEELIPGTNLQSQVLSSTGPAGGLISLLLNEDWRKGEDIERIPGEWTSFMSIPMSKKLKHTIMQAPYSSMLRDWERLNPFEVFGTTEKRAVRPDWEGPRTSVLGLDVPITTKRTGPYKAFEEPSQGSRLGTYLTGIKTYESDRAVEKEKWGREQADLYRTYGVRREFARIQHDYATWAHYNRLMEEIEGKILTAP